MLRLGINPLLVLSISVTRGNVATHLTFTIRTFSYSIHFALSVLNEEPSQ